MEQEDALHPDVRNWLVHGLRHAWDELERYLRTAAQMTLHPRRFAAAWTRGESQAFNPLLFFATSVGITSALGALADHWTQAAVGSSSSYADIEQNVEPYIQYFVLGLLCHVFLRPLGARQPWYATLGISLLAGGGPAAAADVLTDLFSVVVAVLPRSSESLTAQAVNGVAVAGVVLANAVFVVAFVLGLAGVHRMRLWRVVTAFTLAQLTLTGLRLVLFKLLLGGGVG